MDYESLSRLAHREGFQDCSSPGLLLIGLFFVSLAACWISSISPPSRSDEPGPGRELIRRLMAKGRANLTPDASGIPANHPR